MLCKSETLIGNKYFGDMANIEDAIFKAELDGRLLTTFRSIANGVHGDISCLVYGSFKFF